MGVGLDSPVYACHSMDRGRGSAVLAVTRRTGAPRPLFAESEPRANAAPCHAPTIAEISGPEAIFW